MEWWLVGLGVLIILTILNTAREAAIIRRDVARLDLKLNLLLKHMNIPLDATIGLSERVKELARDPSHKIEAIKLHRQETGASLAEAKEAVEDWISSLQR
jgi:hypothetical protein